MTSQQHVQAKRKPWLKSGAATRTAAFLNNFFLNEHNKKNPGFVDLKKPARSIQQIGLLGAGLMGSAIAKCFLEKGFSIRVFDVNEKQLETTDELIAPSLNGKNGCLCLRKYPGRNEQL